MIGVIVPAHNEEQLLSPCLQALALAACDPLLRGEQVCIVVVLDACEDQSAAIAADYDVTVLSIDQRNVGHARRRGAAWLLERGARWLACTDADSRVPGDWLSGQLACEADVVCGTVTVDSWDEHGDGVRQIYLSHYQQREGHRHIHGANLGVCAQAYQRVGGFATLPAHEDVALVRALEDDGARIVWTARNSVITSARRQARAHEGFSDYLKSLAVDMVAGTLAPVIQVGDDSPRRALPGGSLV